MDNFMIDMCKKQAEYAEIYHQQTKIKKKTMNEVKKAKEYYGNSKEYYKEWYKNGAQTNK